VRSFHANVQGTFNVLEAARRSGVRRVLFASSAAAEDPTSPYGAYKASGEHICRAYHSTYGLETVVLRFTNVYGPHSGHKTSVVAAFIRSILHGEPVTIHGTGEQGRDFVYVADVCRGIEQALAAPPERVAGRTFALGYGQQHSILFLLAQLETIHRAPVPSLIQGAVSDRSRSPSPIDLGPAQQAIGYTPAVSLLDGLHSTYQWFQDSLSLKEAPAA